MPSTNDHSKGTRRCSPLQSSSSNTQPPLLLYNHKTMQAHFSPSEEPFDRNLPIRAMTSSDHEAQAATVQNTQRPIPLTPKSQRPHRFEASCRRRTASGWPLSTRLGRSMAELVLVESCVAKSDTDAVAGGGSLGPPSRTPLLGRPVCPNLPNCWPAGPNDCCICARPTPSNYQKGAPRTSNWDETAPPQSAPNGKPQPSKTRARQLAASLSIVGTKRSVREHLRSHLPRNTVRCTCGMKSARVWMDP